jgi:cold shock protein
MTRGFAKHGPVDGRVVLWLEEEGWGALASNDVNGEVWAHFSNIRGEGYKRLRAGQPVRFTYETAAQDGYAHRALWVDAT